MTEDRIQICPHCGHDVQPFKTTCQYCGKLVVLSQRLPFAPVIPLESQPTYLLNRQPDTSPMVATEPSVPIPQRPQSPAESTPHVEPEPLPPMEPITPVESEPLPPMEPITPVEQEPLPPVEPITPIEPEQLSPMEPLGPSHQERNWESATSLPATVARGGKAKKTKKKSTDTTPISGKALAWRMMLLVFLLGVIGFGLHYFLTDKVTRPAVTTVSDDDDDSEEEEVKKPVTKKKTDKEDKKKADKDDSEDDDDDNGFFYRFQMLDKKIEELEKLKN